MHERAGRAFTITELLMVIAVVGLLLSLLVPAVRATRDAARDVSSLANLRTHGQVFQMYAGDSDDWLPQFADPAATQSVVRGSGIAIAFRYFEAVVWWPIFLSDSYYGGSALTSDAFVHPASPEGEFCDYIMSSALLAAPPYWDAESRTGPEQWGGCRVTQVRFPGAKALLVEWHPLQSVPVPTASGDRLSVGLGLIDGSARRFGEPDLVRPYFRGDGDWPGSYQSIGMYGMHTPGGWLGRDVR